ncbi:MAG: hypothetical protein VX253_05865 [Bacteroidota bacterium]|nr:hypothetical protein [Bacteroidota bacterium]
MVSVAFTYWCVQLNKFDKDEHHNIHG